MIINFEYLEEFKSEKWFDRCVFTSRAAQPKMNFRNFKKLF